jgi:hypothetical protein
MNSFLIVFRGINQQQGMDKIRNSNSQDKWIMRESATQAGMISIDTIYGSYRFAYIPNEEKWESAVGSALQRCKEQMEQITFSNSNFAIRIDGLLLKVNDTIGLKYDDLILPTEFEASSNYAYLTVQDDNKDISELEDMTCPISFELLKECEQVGMLNGRYYKYESIEKWVRDTQQDPLTRKYATISDIKKSNLFNLVKERHYSKN